LRIKPVTGETKALRVLSFSFDPKLEISCCILGYRQILFLLDHTFIEIMVDLSLHLFLGVKDRRERSKEGQVGYL
jgi:hypothetical protein